jgi:hypothetical protein
MCAFPGKLHPRLFCQYRRCVRPACLLISFDCFSSLGGGYLCFSEPACIYRYGKSAMVRHPPRVVTED